MNIQELIAQATKAATEDGFGAATAVLYRAYEQAVADIRAAREQSEASAGTKLVLEQLDFSDETQVLAFEAMNEVREVVFQAVSTDRDAAILLYDALKDYASNEVKDFRDDLISQYKRGMSVTVEPEEEAALPDVTTEELKDLRSKALAFWTVDGMPKLNPTDAEVAEDELIPKTKTLKDGSLTLAFSNLPKNLKGGESTDSSSKADGTTHSRLRYTVDSTELPPGTSMSQVGLWYLSSPDWTVTVEEVKREVAKQTGTEYKDAGDFEVEVNGHVLSRRRETL